MKSFEQFRQELAEASASDYAYQPRSPAAKEFLNQHILVKFNKLSIPVQDNNVFNAENLGIKQGKRIADKDNVDDHSVGYHTPVIFGDYVSRFMQMRTEGEDLSVDEEDFLNEVLLMDLEELEDIVENTWKAGNDILSIKSDVHGHQVHVWSPVVGKFIPQGPQHKTRHDAVQDIEKGWKGIKEENESFPEGSFAPVNEGEESHFSMDVDAAKFSGRLKRMTKDATGKYSFQVHTNPMFRKPGPLDHDQFVMKLHGEDGRMIHLGTHPSLEGAKKFITHHTSGIKDD